MKSVLFALLLSSGFAQADVGFSKGNTLTAVLSQGEISVHCDASGPVGGPSFGVFRCQQDLILTGEYDYFQGPAGVIADDVTLTAVHEDGSKRTKNVGYDSANGRSSKKINLWIATLLQKPLLDPGVNQVSYVMTRNGKTVATGAFVATVKDGGTKVCSRRGVYWSNSSMDCQSGGSFCSQFFYENNYCL